MKLIIVGDEALTPEEFERREMERKYQREYRRRRWADDPEFRQRRIEYQREWRKRNPDKRYRTPTVTTKIASLHDVGCSGPTKATGCRCHKTLIRLTQS